MQQRIHSGITQADYSSYWFQDDLEVSCFCFYVLLVIYEYSSFILKYAIHY